MPINAVLQPAFLPAPISFSPSPTIHANNDIQKAFGRVIVCADGAHALGASRNGVKVGNIADFTAFSFHAVKNFTTAEGGASTWKAHAKPGFNRNLWYNAYQGCCMAFKRDIVALICPIPRDIAMHDQWIGLLVEKTGAVDFLEERLILYRRHKGSNSAKRIGIAKKHRYIKTMKQNIEIRISRNNIIESL